MAGGLAHEGLWRTRLHHHPGLKPCQPGARSKRQVEEPRRPGRVPWCGWVKRFRPSFMPGVLPCVADAVRRLAVPLPSRLRAGGRASAHAGGEADLAWLEQHLVGARLRPEHIELLDEAATLALPPAAPGTRWVRIDGVFCAAWTLQLRGGGTDRWRHGHQRPRSGHAAGIEPGARPLPSLVSCRASGGARPVRTGVNGMTLVPLHSPGLLPIFSTLGHVPSRGARTCRPSPTASSTSPCAASL